MGIVQDVFDAIARNDGDQLQQLIAVDPSLASIRNEAGISALMFAAYHRHAELVQLLRAAIPALDVFEATTLGETDRLEALLDQDSDSVASRSADGFTPLHLAAFFNQLDVAKLLIAAGADPNTVAKNASRVQPLHSAAAARAVEVVRLLLEHGAQPNASQHGGWTALQSAAKHGDLDMVELLIQFGANPNQSADDGQTAITMAANDQVRARLQSV